jgi:hypothetical protein
MLFPFKLIGIHAFYKADDFIIGLKASKFIWFFRVRTHKNPFADLSSKFRKFRFKEDRDKDDPF